MHTLVSFVAVAALLAPGPVAAEDSVRNNKADRHRMVSRLKIPPLPELARTQAGQTATQKKDRSWPGRHPVVFGLLIGTGAGAVVGAASLQEPHNPDVTREISAAMGATWGAGLGALAGVVVGIVRD